MQMLTMLASPNHVLSSLVGPAYMQTILKSTNIMQKNYTSVFWVDFITFHFILQHVEYFSLKLIRKRFDQVTTIEC